MSKEMYRDACASVRHSTQAGMAPCLVIITIWGPEKMCSIYCLCVSNASLGLSFDNICLTYVELAHQILN